MVNSGRSWNYMGGMFTINLVLTLLQCHGPWWHSIACHHNNTTGIIILLVLWKLSLNCCWDLPKMVIKWSSLQYKWSKGILLTALHITHHTAGRNWKLPAPPNWRHYYSAQKVTFKFIFSTHSNNTRPAVKFQPIILFYCPWKWWEVWIILCWIINKGRFLTELFRVELTVVGGKTFFVVKLLSNVTCQTLPASRGTLCPAGWSGRRGAGLGVTGGPSLLSLLLLVGGGPADTPPLAGQASTRTGTCWSSYCSWRKRPTIPHHSQGNLENIQSYCQIYLYITMVIIGFHIHLNFDFSKLEFKSSKTL